MAKLPARLRLPTLKLKELEAMAIRLALERNFWSLAEAAEELGISRWALMRRMRSIGLRSPRAVRRPSMKPDGTEGSEP
jgi:DNA-binding NtrC family response regulator